VSSGRPFLVLSCRLGPGGEEDLGGALFGAPVLGCEIVPAEDGGTQARIYLAPGEEHWALELRKRLASQGATVMAEEELEAEDWLRPFRERAMAFTVGSMWWIDPDPGSGGRPPAGRVRLAVEPRMAFGAGTHETTRLVLEELETLPVAGRRVLDLGTGSGILAVAASALGAELVAGLDIEPTAVFEARRTAGEQAFETRARFLAGSMEAIDPACRFDLILCNMIWERMRPLLPAIFRSMTRDGTAVLSGLLRAQEEAVTEELCSAGFTGLARRELGEWLGLAVRRG